VVQTGDVLDRPEDVELDHIDDELFATDYRSPSQRRHRTVLPEPPTVRLLMHPAPAQRRVVVAGAMWPGGAEFSTSPYTSDENGTEIVALIGIAVLLIVSVAAAAVVLVWWL
jgi:hypothetical protein